MAVSPLWVLRRCKSLIRSARARIHKILTSKSSCEAWTMIQLFRQRAKTTSAVFALLVGFASSGTAQNAPLETASYVFPGLQVADTLRKGAVLGAVGQQQANLSSSGGTGDQLYHWHLEYGVTDRLQIGATIQRFEDPLTIGGVTDDFSVRGLSGQAAYRFIDNGPLQMTLRGSVEQYKFRNLFYGLTTQDNQTVGSVHIPVSYQVSDALKLHATAGVSVFPESINGVAYYGVIPQIGIGASLRASERLSFYGSVNAPFGDNGNSINTDGSLSNVPVWTLGGSFNVTPKAAIDVYVTNGMGATPATQILTFPQGGDEVLIGTRITYTPGRGPGYRPNYRGVSGERSERQHRLGYHGLTVSSADTLDPGRVLVWGQFGDRAFGGGGVSFSPDYDLEVGLTIERFSDDGTVPAALLPGTGTRVRLSGKMRLLDQHNGSPFTLSGLVIAGRAPASRLGSLYLSAPASFLVNDRLSLTAEPKFGAFGGQRYYGLAAGANFELFDGFELIGEGAVIDGANGSIWSAGARYHLSAVPVAFEVQATNAIGNYGVGSMIAQDTVRYSAGFKVALDGKSIWDRFSGRN